MSEKRFDPEQMRQILDEMRNTTFQIALMDMGQAQARTYDTLQNYGDVLHGVPREEFEQFYREVGPGLMHTLIVAAGSAQRFALACTSLASAVSDRLASGQ